LSLAFLSRVSPTRAVVHRGGDGAGCESAHRRHVETSTKRGERTEESERHNREVMITSFHFVSVFPPAFLSVMITSFHFVSVLFSAFLSLSIHP
jgi:hypothetical protein